MSDTPRTDAIKPEGAFHHWTTDQLFAHSRKLERELSAATAELAATKEQLRVAREAIRKAEGEMEFGNYVYAQDELKRALKTLTQPNLSADSLGGGNPAKGEGGVPLTFPA